MLLSSDHAKHGISWYRKKQILSLEVFYITSWLLGLGVTCEHGLLLASMLLGNIKLLTTGKFSAFGCLTSGSS